MGKRFIALGFALLMAFQASPLAASAADLTTKYRVYEENRIVMEYASKDKAIEHAKKLRNSHVELIENREWVWDNLPRYRVYQYEVTLPEWQYATLEEAIATAKKYANSSVRDLQSGGWVWSSYAQPRRQYKLMQYDVSLPEWIFDTLEEAQKEAKKWANSHIIDLGTNEWIWDNISEERKAELRAGEQVYQMYIGNHTEEDWKFAYLEDAVNAALKYDGAVVYHVKKQKEVYANRKNYEVYQNDKYLQGFVLLEDALAYANKWAHATIKWKGRVIWSNYPYYRVFQNDKLIKEFNNVKDAVAYAKQYSNSSVVTLHDEILWDNRSKLLYLGWTGTANPDTIRNQVSQTMGVDIVSPTYFELAGKDGSLKDSSDAATVQWLKQQGFKVHPLVRNDFSNRAATSAFLNDANARAKFIEAVVGKAAALKVDGLNLDFESLAGSDRDAFTQFVRSFTEAAHAKNLLVSIDLPRGSIRWNHLTAFDHEKLAGIVDYIIIMAYDQHYSGSETAGSVSGLQWTEEGIGEFLSYGIPRGKLILGIPFYSRVWTLDAKGNPTGNRSLLMRDIPAILDRPGTSLTWDPAFNQYKVTYTENGATHVFWLEDPATVEERLKLAKKYDLAGVAAWRLGHEYAAIWETMLKNK